MFCKICGKELHENAVVCVGCGCLVDQEKVKSKTPQTSSGGQLNLYKLALILAIIAAFPLLSLAISEEQLVCAFVLSMIFIFTSFIFATLGLILEKTKPSKLYCTTAIILAFCSFICVFANFVCLF